MRSLPTLLFSALAATAQAADGGGSHPQAKQYKDAGTGISFLGFADGTGYQFGMAMPKSPTTDFIAQLVSPLTRGGGWAGIDFGASMAGHLMVVAWPNGDKVMVAPRFATGYDASQTTPYSQRSLNLTQIAKGTFVNATHVSATFVCGGCIGADAFARSDASAVFAFAYSSVAVSSPGDAGAQISDHTTNNEPYGPFGVKFADAQSGEYDAWAAMAVQGKAGGGSTGGGSSSGAQPSGSSAGSTSPPSSSVGGGEDGDGISPTSGTVVILAMIGFVYLLQTVSSF